MVPHSQIDPIESTLDFLFRSIYPQQIPMTGKYVTDSIGDAYKDWKRGNPVFLDAPTGTRKTTFIYEKIIPHAIANGQNVLLISNRIALSLQQKKTILEIIRKAGPTSIEDVPANPTTEEIGEYTYIGPVCVATYQGLYSLLNTPNDDGQYPLEWYRKLRYVVFDEIHFLYSDALFNPICGHLLKKLPVVFSSVIRIYMTATPWEIKDEIFIAEQNARSNKDFLSLTPIEQKISEYSGYVPNDYPISRKFLYYHMDADYSSYRLHFFYDDSDEDDEDTGLFYVEKIIDMIFHPLIREMRPLPSENDKWLIFVDKKSLGKKLAKQLKVKAVSVAYVDAKKRTPKDVWNHLITKESVDASVLIATSVIQNGVNIHDPNAHHIGIFCTDRTSFIQELGRKRLDNGEIVDLWVWVPHKEYFEKMERKIQWHLHIATSLNSDNNNLTPRYAKAVKELWENTAMVNYPALFYVNRQGQFRANEYALEVLKKQLCFIQEFTHKYNPLSFESTVQEWLGIRQTQDVPEMPKTTLDELLKQNAGKILPEEAFSPIRQAIIYNALKKTDSYIPPKRRPKASAVSLNPMLAKLGLPYTVEKAKKVWTITPTTPPAIK